MNILRRVLPVLLPLVVLASTVESKKGSLIPVEDFFRRPLVSRMTLSPDGLYAAGLAPIGKGSDIGLAVFNLATMEYSSMSWKPGYDIYAINWVNDTDIAFNVGRWNAYATGIYRTNREKKGIVPLVGGDVAAQVVDPMPNNSLYSWIWVYDSPEDKPMLAKMRLDESAMSSTVYRRKIDSFSLLEEREYLPRNKSEFGGAVIDWAGELRIMGVAEKGVAEYRYRNAAEEEWAALALDPEEWRIVHFHRDNKLLYVAGYHGEETKGLYTYDMETHEIGELLYRDDYYDFSETADYKYYNNSLIGITYQRDVPTTVWFLPELEKVQKMVDGALPGRVNVIKDWNRDFTKLLIHTYSDVAPVEYIYLDLEKKSLKSIAKSRPWLDASKLARTQVLRFKTADGLALEGYLTLPKQGKAPYPMVCLVHDGPWARDTGSFDPDTQFLANRGYAVLRVNYRGSTGYGKIISEDPAYDFRRMHEDITEGVKLMVKQGIADPARLAIMGSSFGGYAALCGAAFEPELYQCAVTVVGVFDWEMLVKARKGQRRYYSHAKLTEELGAGGDLQAKFEEISPIRHVDAIRMPIFIAHGKIDNNVSVRQSKLLQSELKKRNIPHETFYRAWEGHGFFDDKNRIELYEQVGDFLGKYL